MPQGSRDIQRRIKTVRNIKKITRAMELVSASKMRKSVNRVLASRAYAETAWNMVMDLIPRVDPSHHPLLQERPTTKAVIVLIGSNRGLCGAFNINIIFKALDLISREGWQKNQVDFIAFGKKTAHILHTLHRTIIADYPKNDITESMGDTLPISKEIMNGFINQRYDEVYLAYTDFRSSLKQDPRIRHLLPLIKPSRFLGHVGSCHNEQPAANVAEYLFEPSRNAVLAALLPRLIDLQVYQAVLESEASEHSARMMAMHNATDSAADMIDSLSLAFNQARQAGITAELAEITATSVAIR